MIELKLPTIAGSGFRIFNCNLYSIYISNATAIINSLYYSNLFIITGKYYNNRHKIYTGMKYSKSKQLKQNSCEFHMI